jgi:arylsulfatase A-like enzyme/tetratricopeptide (TPR) repeat protein
MTSKGRVASRLLLLLVVTSATLASPPACRRRPGWNVLLVTFDTTRADHIGCYGRSIARTPNLDRLAAEGVRFANAYSAIPLTCPSHSTMLTGKYPIAHGVRDNSLFVLGPEQRTLAEILKERGYRTAASVGGFPLVARYGLNQGFDFYDDRLTEPFDDFLGRPPRPSLFLERREAARVNEPAVEWLGRNPSQPFFLWVHYYDAHQPYLPHVPYNELFADSPYDGEIAYADESLGVILDRLRKLGLYDNTLVVFTSDHGEGLSEHNELTHSYLLYDTTLHVPLIVRPPAGVRGGVVDGRVRLVDIAPTVLDLLGVPIPADMQGRSLVSLLEGKGDVKADRTHYAETLSPRLSQNWGELRALYDGPWKYIHGPRPELFDIRADPREVTNLVGAKPEVAAEMRGKLADFLKHNSPPGGSHMAAVDEETRRRLEALGYIAAGAGAEQEIREVLRSDGIAPQDRAGDISLVSSARAFIEQGRPFPAREAARTLLSNAPNDPLYLELLALSEIMLGRVDDALPIVEKIVASAPNRGTAERLMLSIGEARYRRGEHEAGLKMIRRSLEIRPVASGYYLLASLEALEGHPEEELQALRASLERDAKYAPARLDLAVRLAQAGRRQEAEKEMQRVVQENPYYAKGQYNYGAFLLEGGEAERALRCFERAVTLEPDYAKARYAVIAVRLRLGQRTEAERELQALEARTPGSGEADEARRLLEEAR